MGSMLDARPVAEFHAFNLLPSSPWDGVMDAYVGPLGNVYATAAFLIDHETRQTFSVTLFIDRPQTPSREPRVKEVDYVARMPRSTSTFESRSDVWDLKIRWGDHPVHTIDTGMGARTSSVYRDATASDALRLLPLLARLALTVEQSAAADSRSSRPVSSPRMWTRTLEFPDFRLQVYTRFKSLAFQRFHDGDEGASLAELVALCGLSEFQDMGLRLEAGARDSTTICHAVRGGGRHTYVAVTLALSL